MRPVTPRPTRLVPAETLLEPTNQLLAKAGIKSLADLHRLLETQIKDIPEVKKLASVCERHGAIGVLAGGTASMLIAEAIENAASSQTKVRSLNDMGSDIDALVMNKRFEELNPALGNKIAAELNDSNSLILHSSVPSSLRRRVVLEWDINEVSAFAKATEAYGGDPLSQIGIGLSGNRLYLFDPHGGLDDFFHGRLRWLKPKDNPYESPLFEGLQYDPALEGLRLIRMIGRFKQAGVEPTDETRDELKEFGASALRKRLVSKALVNSPDESGDFKLKRRWEKYVTRIWADSADLSESLSLVNENHYSELLQHMGMGQLILQPLVDQPITKFTAGEIRPGITRGADLGSSYLWLSSRMHEQFAAGKVFGARTKEGALGVACQGSLFDGKGYGSILTKVHVSPEAGFLDLRSASGRAIMQTVVDRLGIGEESDATKLDRVLQDLGLAGILTGGQPADVTITTSSAITKFEVVKLDVKDIFDELPRTEPNKVGLALRVAISLGRQTAADDLAARIADGRVDLTRILDPGAVDALLEAPIKTAKLQTAIESQSRKALSTESRLELVRLFGGWSSQERKS
jgi:hypothetical protein